MTNALAEHLWCPVCKAGAAEPLSRAESDRHIFAHIVDGRRADPDETLFRKAIARTMLRLMDRSPT
jgi:hypothetical protein